MGAKHSNQVIPGASRVLGPLHERRHLAGELLPRPTSPARTPALPVLVQGQGERTPLNPTRPRPASRHPRSSATWRLGASLHAGLKFIASLVVLWATVTSLLAQSADWQQVIWREPQVRYFMADIALGGSIEFYRAAAERDHEMGCLEAVRRTEDGYRITNLDQFERKRAEGKVLITRKGSDERISGLAVTLSSD